MAFKYLLFFRLVVVVTWAEFKESQLKSIINYCQQLYFQRNSERLVGISVPSLWGFVTNGFLMRV